MLAVPACGESGAGSRDAAANRDGAEAPPLDAAGTPNHDAAVAFDGSSTDLDANASLDLPLVPDLASTADGPMVSEAGGEDAPPASAVDTAPDQATGSLDATIPRDAAGPVDTSSDGGSSSAPEDATPMDTSVETASSFCTGLESVDAGVLQRACYDFSDPASAADFVPEAGTWFVTNGTYTAVAPSEQVTCPDGDGSLMTESVLANLTAQDVRVHAKMTAISAPDKVIVLRSRPGGNRIELNFRANFVFDDIAQGGDLYISALVDCVQVTYVPVETILIPHAIGQTIVVDVELIGRHLAVVVDGKTVFDDTLPPPPNDAGTVSCPADPGKVGFAAFRDAVTQFDDFLVEVLN